MMRFWGREIAGWLLVAAGLFVFYVCMAMLLGDPSRFFEAGPLTLIGIIVFRGGIHLLKVAVAARICMKAPMTAAARTSRRESAAAATQQPLEW